MGPVAPRAEDLDPGTTFLAETREYVTSRWVVMGDGGVVNIYGIENEHVPSTVRGVVAPAEAAGL